MKKVLVLCGYPRSGKDTIADHLVKQYDFTRVALADPVRQAALVINPYIRTTWMGQQQLNLPPDTYRLSWLVKRYGWDQSKILPEVRKLLQIIGTEAGRDIHGQDCWLRLADKAIQRSPGPVVITDARFDNEFAHFQRHYHDLRTILIERPGIGKVNDHRSEQADYRQYADGTLMNNGTLADLYATVDAMVGNWKLWNSTLGQLN